NRIRDGTEERELFVKTLLPPHEYNRGASPIRSVKIRNVGPELEREAKRSLESASDRFRSPVGSPSRRIGRVRSSAGVAPGGHHMPVRRKNQPPREHPAHAHLKHRRVAIEDTSAMMLL